VVVDATGSVEFGAHVALEAFRYGKDVVLMNAAAALVAAGRADSLGDAMPMAVKSLDSGAARKKLEGLVEFTNRAA